jgi:hypothetical protein
LSDVVQICTTSRRDACESRTCSTSIPGPAHPRGSENGR